MLNRLLDDGDISSADVKAFYQAVRDFYTRAADYALANPPLSDPVLQNSRLVDFEKRYLHEFSQVEVFVARYPELLPSEAIAELGNREEEFLDCQLMDDADILNDVWESAVTEVDEAHKYYRMDMIWNYLSSMTSPDGVLRFHRLARVAKLVLILPHSNASEERVFSMDKTMFRPNLKLDGTPSNILTVKLANLEPCHMYEPEKSVLDTAKRATMVYNRAH